MALIERRLRALELAHAGPGKWPAYICAKDEAELERLAEGLTRPTKAYIGFCPDDWDEIEVSHEPGA